METIIKARDILPESWIKLPCRKNKFFYISKVFTLPVDFDIEADRGYILAFTDSCRQFKLNPDLEVTLWTQDIQKPSWGIRLVNEAGEYVWLNCDYDFDLPENKGRFEADKQKRLSVGS